MKNFTKLLMAVVLLVSYSCVQDTTEDLAPVISEPNVESGEVKTLQVSMPVSSRTSLGEKGENGKYPISWSEGDCLAVNGKPTASITINEDDASVAVFELPTGITIPYHVVYPYQGDDVSVNAGSGAYPVVFASEQVHTVGSFAKGSAPMFAWSNGFDGIHMEHLATALRFSIKPQEGETVTLRYISVSTVEAEPISGTFDVYCADKGEFEAGTLKAREDAVSTVFYNFKDESGKNVEHELTGEESFFIAVPKGEYSRFEVNFVEQSGLVFTKTFDASGDKQLLGGKVREFPTVEFNRDECEKMLLIGTDADMETFANEVNGLTFNDKYDGALLINDIDMTKSERKLESIDGFTSVFEGRNYTIKGLTAPLFGKDVVATISNVRVEGNLVEENLGQVGLIARSIGVAGDKVGAIFNCAASGSIEYKNDKIAVNDHFDLINVGGIVGSVYGGSVTRSKSNVNVTISKVAGEEAKDKAFIPCVGGVVGYACASADGEKLPVVVDNTSNGVVIWDDQSKSAKVTPYIGGVAGYVTAGAFTDNVNGGQLFINEPMYDLDWGGVIGASAVTIERCENKGSMTINEQITKANIGGVLGRLEVGSAVDCENSGKLLFDEKFCVGKMEGTTVVSTGTCNIGGVIAIAEKGTKSIRNCTNSGSITYLGSCAYAGRDKLAGNSNIVLGGVLGTAWSEAVENCRNLESAEVFVGGSVAGNGNLNQETGVNRTAIAGVIGTRVGKKSELGYSEMASTKGCGNQGNVSFSWQYNGAAYIFSSGCIGFFDSDYVDTCTNEGYVSVQVRVSSDDVTLDTTNTLLAYISGLFGCIGSSCDQIFDCQNIGTVEVVNSHARFLYVSGMLGTTIKGASVILTRCANAGDVIVQESVSASKAIYVGGLLSNSSNVTLQYPNCFNSGKIICKATAPETVMGSIFGLVYNADKGQGTEGIYNSGQVIYEGNSAAAYVGGYCGIYYSSYNTVEFTNTITGSVEYKGSASLSAFVGGIFGVGGYPTLKTETDSNDPSAKPNPVDITFRLTAGGDFTKGMSNNGNVSILGYAPEINVGGCFGAVRAQNGIGGLSNAGTVTVPDNLTASKYPKTIYLGGVFGYANMGVAYPATTGIVSKTNAVRDCYNTGDVIYSGIARDGAYVGGIVGRAEMAPVFDCENTGEVFSNGHAGEWCPRYGEADEKADKREFAMYFNHDLAVGGIVGESDLDLSGCVNGGDVTHECLLNPLRMDIYGEQATSRFDVGGIAGRIFVTESNKAYYHLMLSGLQNNGAVTIKGVPSATLCSPSADLESNGEYQWTDVDDSDRMNKRPYVRVNVAGLVGRMFDLSQKSGGAGESVENRFFMSGCTNNGPVTVPEAGGAKCLSVAGAVADLIVSHMEFDGVANTSKGTISVDNVGVGTIIAGKQMMHAYFINLGGIVATYFDHRIFANTAKNWSTGENDPYHHVTFNYCSNDGKISYRETGASVYQCAGGILAQVLHTAADRSVNIGVNGYTAGKWYKSFTTVSFNGCRNGSPNTDYGSIKYNSTIMSSLSSHYNYNYAGGILGSGGLGHASLAQWYNAVSLKFDHCENYADIQFDRSNGTASDNADPFYTAVGGIVGHYTGGIGKTGNADAQSGTATTRENGCSAQIISCKNYGYIHGFSGIVGGIIGNGNWYVKITGTQSDPTLNKGDIVVIRDNGNVVTKNRYGRKYMYVGGIAGYMREFHDVSYAVASANEGDNNAHPDYMPEHMFCRIEHAVNEGAVGSTGYAGGIAGYYYSAVEASNRTGKVCSHRGGMEFCRNTGDIYALEETTINVGAIVGMPRMFSYSGSESDDITSYLLSKEWQIGVRNCQVGGTVLRGAIDKFTADKSNYQHLIYGGSWLPSYTSVLSGAFDGCTAYVTTDTETPDAGEGGEGGSEGEGAEPTAKR